VRVAVVVSVLTSAMIKLIKLIFTTREDNVQCPASSAENPAPLIEHSQPGISEWVRVEEVWTWMYYSAEANTQMGGRMHTELREYALLAVR